MALAFPALRPGCGGGFAGLRPPVFSLGKESHRRVVASGHQSRASAPAPVSKVEGNARARPNSARPSHTLLVPKSLQGLTGTPLVAGSPIRHESALQGSAVEVQTYQPPWKTLSEFALQSDLDQPTFQQLVRPRPARTIAALRRGLSV